MYVRIIYRTHTRILCNYTTYYVKLTTKSKNFDKNCRKLGARVMMVTCAGSGRRVEAHNSSYLW